MQPAKMVRILVTAVTVVGLVQVRAEDVARPRYEKGPALPAAWSKVTEQERLGAKLAAETDAKRLLAERIYGLDLDAETEVADLALASDEIRGALDTMLRGVRTEEVAYKDDLSIEAVCAVTIRSVVETIEREYRKNKGIFRVREESFETRKVEAKDNTLRVMGNGAVAGSLGQKRILAKRAAEMDCYRRIAGRVIGTKLNASTSIRDLVTQDDGILARVAACLNGVKFTDIVYNERDSCKVTGQLTLVETIETVERTCLRQNKLFGVRKEEWEKVTTESHDKVIVEVGEGAPRPDGAAEGVAFVGTNPLVYQKEIIRRVIRTEIKLD